MPATQKALLCSFCKEQEAVTVLELGTNPRTLTTYRYLSCPQCTQNAKHGFTFIEYPLGATNDSNYTRSQIVQPSSADSR